MHPTYPIQPPTCILYTNHINNPFMHPSHPIYHPTCILLILYTILHSACILLILYFHVSHSFQISHTCISYSSILYTILHASYSVNASYNTILNASYSPIDHPTCILFILYQTTCILFILYTILLITTEFRLFLLS